MISYERSAYGWRLLFQFHGSAVYRSILPSLVSVALYFLYKEYNIEGKGVGEEDILHPYAVGVLVASSTFLIIFKLNQSYGRYWEACGATNQFMSKWMDASTHTACYHMQCDHYTKMKPPCFYDYPELNSLFMTRDRERSNFDSVDDEYEQNNNDDTGLRYRKQSTNGHSGSEVDIPVPDDPDSREHSTRSNSEYSESKLYARYHSGESKNNNTQEDSKIHRNVGIAESKKMRKKRQQLEKEEYRRRSISKSINYLEAPSKSHRHMSTSQVSRPTLNRRSTSIQSLYDVTSIAHIDESDGEYSRHTSTSQVSRSTLNRRSTSIQSLYDVTSIAHIDKGDDEYSESLCYEEVVFHSAGAEPIPLVGKPRLDGGWGEYYTNNSKQPFSTFVDPRHPNKIDPKGFASIQGGRTPPLFLQELAHLSSLLNAVALSTLRNDMEGCESPLAIYEAGQKFPDVNPYKQEWLKKKGFDAVSSYISTFFGVGLTDVQRNKHNCSLPLPVIGGVSDAEIRFLQIARGPQAKTQLCFNWLTEFVIREHLAGSLGNVGPPIISRIIQFLGDGMIYYNHSRKIMFIPFPFVHEQLSVTFVIIMIFVIPFLMHQYTDEPLVGVSLTFLTVLCLCGINEVARDLENPFRNFPNELPLVTFQAQFNEALITIYAGYHPDFFWDGDQVMCKANMIPGTGIQKECDEKNTQKPVVSQKTSTEETSEIAALQRQLEEQSKLIRKLVAKEGSVEE
mmetsp:Transcript_51079/g.57075  ORF Transcript_51079/g.57075 Transcript_51079/m.57075 type:complete len:735 (+) Transcript_51079:122-2326(+)